MVKAAILHEGSPKNTADKKLITSLLKHLNLDENFIFFDAFHSKDNFFKVDDYEDKHPILVENVKNGGINKILFIVDADTQDDDIKYKGFDNTKNELLNVIDKLGWQDKASIYIFCDPIKKTGYLESFILSTIPDKHRECIKKFLECSQFKIKGDDKSYYKGIYSNIAYKDLDPPYNFNHQNFDVLKTELIKLFN